ncbi:protocadherin alpha-C2-like isoform X1 [Stigmatopora argus]
MATTADCRLCLIFLIYGGFTTGEIRYSVPEELENGAQVGDVARDLNLDARQFVSRRARVTPQSGRRYVAVHRESGKLVVNERMDRESLCPANAATCSLDLELALDGPPETHRVKVDIADVNDNAPRFPQSEYFLEVSESAVAGSKFHVEAALDPDDGSNSVHRYHLDPNRHLSLDSVKPPANNKHIELILKKPYDREQMPSDGLVLTAVDGGTPQRSGTAKIHVRVLDANDNAPAFDRSVYRVKVYENSALGTPLIRLNATDADEGPNGDVFYSFGSYTPERVRRMFSLDADTGEITAKKALDREEASSYEMYVQATDKGPAAVPAHCKVVVEVLDLNDNVPKVTLASVNSPVREDARVDTVVAVIVVSDRDSGANRGVVLELAPPSPFKIKHFRNRYAVVTSGVLDRESVSSYNLTIRATDEGAPPLSSEVTFAVEVADVNDNPPRFEQTSYTVYVSENNAPGSPLCAVRAADADSGENARVGYAILDDYNYGVPVASYVGVKAATGEAYALRTFDFEKLREFHFQVKAQDHGGLPLSRVATVYVYVVDENDHRPRIVYPPADGSRDAETLARDAEAGALVAKVVAWDGDAGRNAWLMYALRPSDAAADLFKVHGRTGEIRTTRRVTEENATSFALTVVVSDDGLPPLSSTATVRVRLTELPPKLSGDPKRVIRPESPLMFSHVTIYLIIALCATTFVFLVTVCVLAIVRCHAYCARSGSPRPASETAPPEGSAAAAGAGRPASAGGQPGGGVVLRRDLKVEPRYIEVRANGSVTKTYCYKTCLTATSGSDTFMFYNTGRPHSGTWGSGYVTSHSGCSQIVVRRLSMPDANAIQPMMPNSDWRYSASLRAGGVMQSSVHMEESAVMQGAQGVLVQNWPTASSAADAEGGEVSPPMGAGVDSNSWHFRYGPGGPGAPPQHLKPGEVPPEAFIIPGSPAIISIRQNQGGEDDKSDFITFGKKEEAKKKKKKKKDKKDKKDKGKDDDE